MLNRQDVIDWLESPATYSYFAYIRYKIRKLEEQLGHGATLSDESAHTTIVNTAKIIGRIEGHKDDIDVDVSDLIEEK